MSKKKITKKTAKKSKSVKAKKKNYLVVYHVKNVNNRSELKLLLDLDGKYRAYRKSKGNKLWTLEETYKTFRLAFNGFFKLMEMPPWAWHQHPDKKKYQKFMEQVKNHKVS